MKIKKLSLRIIPIIVIAILSLGIFWACEKDNKRGHVPYKECTHEGDYIDTISMEGVGFLFINSVPANLQEENNFMYIIYNGEDDSSTFFATYPTEAMYNGVICNFPDFAKEWEIPDEGKQIFYKGELYVTGVYLSHPPIISGDLILTTLKKI